MGINHEICRAVSDLARECDLGGPSDISLGPGDGYGSGYNERDGYYFVDCGGERYVGGQDAIVHEAARLVRCYNEKELGIGLDWELEGASKLVDNDIRQGRLGESYTALCLLVFSKSVSEEFVACFFGRGKEALNGVNERKSPEALVLLGRKLEEWKTEVRGLFELRKKPGIVSSKTVSTLTSEVKTCLNYSAGMGKLYGAILGNWLAGEQISSREVILHDSSKLFKMLEDLVALDEFPENLVDFIREKGVFGSNGL